MIVGINTNWHLRLQALLLGSSNAGDAGASARDDASVRGNASALRDAACEAEEDEDVEGDDEEDEEDDEEHGCDVVDGRLVGKIVWEWWQNVLKCE